MTTAAMPAAPVTFQEVSDTSKAVAIPDKPVTSTDVALSSAAQNSTAGVQRLRCVSLLGPDTLARAQEEAKRDYPELFKNTPAFLAYGTKDIKPLNDLGDQMLRQKGPDVEAINNLMKDLRRRMFKIKHKWDPSDPDNAKFYNALAGHGGLMTKLYRRGRSAVELLMEDVLSTVSQMDKVTKELQDHEDTLVDNVSYYDHALDLTEDEIKAIIYRIAVMELIQELAIEDAKNIKVGDASAGDRGAELQARYSEFALNMGNKVIEYKGRLIIGWAMSPRIRMARTVAVALAEKVNEMICVAIPTMKNVAAEWRSYAEMQQAQESADAVAGALNDWVTAGAQAAAVILPAAERSARNPSLRPETVMALATYLDQAAEGVIAAREAGAKAQADLESTIRTVMPMITNTSRKLAQAEIDQVTKAQPLEIATSVPAPADTSTTETTGETK